jgi:hypothetical protein
MPEVPELGVQEWVHRTTAVPRRSLCFVSRLDQYETVTHISPCALVVI